MIAGTPPSAALESFLGTVPGMIYRTRLVPPYDDDFISAELFSVVGYPVDDFVGRDPKRRWPDLIDPEDRERVKAVMLGAPADGSIVEVEYRVRRADGSQAWILSRARKLVARDGTPYLHGAAIDVTARHEAAALQRRLEAEAARRAEIDASRARIVEAADAARRRLERDLHDGAQQALVAASLTLARAAAQARATPAETLVAEALDQVRDALAELRELARGIHPAVLSERGLGAALELLAARSPVPVDVRAPAQRLPSSVEAALYCTAAEALTNVAKYAQRRQRRSACRDPRRCRGRRDRRRRRRRRQREPGLRPDRPRRSPCRRRRQARRREPGRRRHARARIRATERQLMRLR